MKSSAVTCELLYIYIYIYIYKSYTKTYPIYTKKLRKPRKPEKK